MKKKYLILSAALMAAVFSACDKQQVVNSSPNASETTATDVPPSESIATEQVKELERMSETDITSEPLPEEITPPTTDTETDTATEIAIDTETAAETANEEINVEPTSFELGGLTLSAEEIPFDSVVSLRNSDSSDAVLYGDTIYILNGKKLEEYTLGQSAEKTNTIQLSGSYSRIDADPYGQLYLSRDRFDCSMIDENGEQTTLDTTGEVSMSKVLEYGLCTNDGKITRFTDEETGEWSSVAESELEFPDNVSAVEFADNHVLVARNSDGGSEVKVFDYEGNSICTTDGGSVGEDITAVTESAGVIAASSCGDLCLWNSSGELIGRLGSDDTARLFGEEQPVIIKKLFPQSDGSMLAFCADSSSDNEAHLYRIMGF